MHDASGVPVFRFAPSTPKATAPQASAVAANSTASFTTGEQIGFASSAISAILGNVLANRANRAQASALREQAGIYDQMSAVIDLYEQFHLREAMLEARRRIGQGRAGFAANGVLVDSGASALWEQDEAADAALEQLDIMQQYEDRSWQYRTQANKAEAEGLLAAANQMGGAVSAAGQAAQAAGAAAATAGQAYALALQAESARSQASRMRKKKSWGATLGVALGAGVGSIFPGIGTAAGAAIGGAAGGVYDASRS